jgi:ATP-dependent DNA helicase RecG
VDNNLLPVNIDDLINKRRIEDARVEFKQGWDEAIKKSVVRDVCAFANDFYNLNGGYIVLGIGEDQGQPKPSPSGVQRKDIDRIQKEIIGACKGGISPEYLPHLSVEEYMGALLIVIWCPAGDNRPYEAPKRSGGGRVYYVRFGPTAAEATGDIQRQLLEIASKIPFDDRRSLSGTEDDISPRLVRKYLEATNSRLSKNAFSDHETYRNMDLLVKLNSHYVPKNVALLLFNDHPEYFFNGAYIEIAQFDDPDGGDTITTKTIKGPIHEQIRNCLDYLDGLSGELIQKIPKQAEVERTVPYPYEAMEEAIVNAIYHKSYESPPEPVKIYLYPDRMTITSYPGPVPGLDLDQLRRGRIPLLPARNRRIGNFLKEMRLAEAKNTGIPTIKRKMRENGSPEAEFNFDENRTYFMVTLPVHPKYLVIHTLRESSHSWLIGEKTRAIELLKESFLKNPASGATATQLIEYSINQDNFSLARETFDTFDKSPVKEEPAQPYLAMARALLDRDQVKEAIQTLNQMPTAPDPSQMLETAILKKRAKDFKGAHQIFLQMYDQLKDDPKLLQEFAQTKIQLAKTIRVSRDKPSKKRLNREASELLRRAIQLSDDPTRTAWCWYDLAWASHWLDFDKSEIDGFFQNAINLLPDEAKFRQGYLNWKNTYWKENKS